MDISIEISASDEKCLMPFLAANDWSSKYIGCEMQWSITITSHDNMTATMIIRNLDCSRQCTRWSEQILSHRPHSKTLSSADRQATWGKYYWEQKNKLCSRLIFFLPNAVLAFHSSCKQKQVRWGSHYDFSIYKKDYFILSLFYPLPFPPS